MTSPIPVAGPLGPGVEYVFTPDEPAFLRMTRSPSGIVARDLVRRAKLVELAARRQIPLGHVAGGPSTRKLATRNLRDTVRTRIAYSDWQPPVAFVGSQHPIALIHHEGTRPHVILPRRPGGVLVFWSGRAGKTIFTRRVNHPGSKANPFLRDNLYLAVQ
jgi:hypothetical protein